MPGRDQVGACSLADGAQSVAPPGGFEQVPGTVRGIPQEDWGSVITVYGDGDGDAVAQFTGNDDGLPGRIVLLDAAGRVAFFHDRGYSAGTLARLKAACDPLR